MSVANAARWTGAYLPFLQEVVALARRKKSESASSCRIQYVKNKELLVAPGQQCWFSCMSSKSYDTAFNNEALLGQ